VNNYLIPANSKKSQLILGFFTPVDLILFGSGVGLTLILLLIIESSSLGLILLILAPALFTSFLVLPIPNYHNVLQFIVNVYTFFSERKRYIWKGWCYKHGEDK